MKSKLTLFLFAMLATIGAHAQLNMTLAGSLPYDVELSNIWGYAAPDGTEYALVGTYDGVSIVSLADPANPVESVLVPGPASSWRELKTWDHYAYASNETGSGLLVMDLAGLPDTVIYHYWAPNIPGLGVLSTIHTVSVDELGYLYLNGTNLNSGGCLFLDLNTDPYNPTYVGKGPAIYSHDSYARNNLLYSFEINNGDFSIYDVADKANPITLASQGTEGNFTHNGWLSDDSKILFTTDEVGNAPVGAYDVSDPANIITLDQFRPFATLGTGVIPHNAHVLNDYVIVSYYTDGCIILDGSKPDNLVEIANFDTFFPSTSGFAGAWGVYPYLPSGRILVSDIGNGLFVLVPNYVRACYLEGKVTDATTGAGLSGASVELIGELTTAQSDLLGNFKTGFATAGIFEALVKKPGYESQTVNVTMENGEVTILNVALQSLPSFVLTGTVVEAGTGLPVPDAKVQVLNSDFNFELTTGSDGKFSVQQFYNGDYDVFAGKWGYKSYTNVGNPIDVATPNLTLELENGYQDFFNIDLGWTVNGDASQGIWERGTPIQVMPAQIPYPIQTGQDDLNEAGNACFVTGNTADLFSGVQTTGTTRLISPIMDLTTMNAPNLRFSTWLFTVATTGAAVGNDKLLVKLANGTQTVTIKEIEFANLFFPPAWVTSIIDISTILPLTDQMQVIFEVGDVDPNVADVVEAGVDFFEAYDADPPSGAVEQVKNGIAISVSPNPSSDEFVFSYQIEGWKNDANLLIYNALGQMVMSQPLDGPVGKVTFGSTLGYGFYFAKIQHNGEAGQPVKLLKQR